MAWDTSDRRARLPSNWLSIRADVFRIRGRRCYVNENGEQCPNEGTEIDHIEAGDNHSLDNLAPICRMHHRRKSSFEGRQAYHKKRRATAWRVKREFGIEEPQPGTEPHEPFKHPWMR